MTLQQNLLNYYLRSFSDDKIKTFQKKAGVELSYQELKRGKLSSQTITKLDEKAAMIEGEIEYLVSPITLMNQEDWKFVTPILIPAVLKENQLVPIENRPPYINRVYLEPSLEPSLESKGSGAFIIGSVDKQDHFTQQNPYVVDYDWEQAWAYAEKLFYEVSGNSISSFQMKGYQRRELSWAVPIGEQKKENSIQSLYKDILEQKQLPPLLAEFLSLEEKKWSPLLNKIEGAERHVGQMNGSYPLSGGQRESLQHFLSLNNSGEVLAVNGPPGTGKTTLLQNVVATLWVEAALKAEEPPIIWATSTNNQPIMNIIDSFQYSDAGKLSQSKSFGEKINQLQGRWITELESFALYFPSNSAMKKLLKKGHHYQVEGNSEKFMKNNMENKNRFQERKKNFLKLCSDYTGRQVTNFEEACQLLHQELLSTHQTLLNGLEIGKGLSTVTQKLQQFGKSEEQISHSSRKLKNQQDAQTEHYQKAVQLKKDWANHCQKEPWWWKFVSFLPSIQEKRRQRALEFLTIVSTDVSIDRSATSFQAVEQEISEFQASREAEWKKATGSYIEIDQLLQERHELSNEWKDWQQEHKLNEKKLNFPFDFTQLTNSLDTTLRYLLFRIATHYWEARWFLEMEEKNRYKGEKKEKRSFRDNRVLQYYRFAKLTPCFVSTLHMLPNQMGAKKKGEVQPDKSSADENYLYNFIDLLIMDEAGQVTPSTAAPSFALAKKALIVGDTKQIEPISNMTQSIDVGNLLDAKVIQNHQQASEVKELGIMSSSGSVMQIAQRRSLYQKNELFGGMFLAEHRRCLDEIITFCNNLAYEGKLVPMRGSKQKYDFHRMGYAHIAGEMEHSGGSKMNIAEAEAIAQWIAENQSQIVAKASQEKGEKYELKDLVAVITPFKHQATLIKIFLKQMEIEDLTVGTVHALQGSERDIILFSPVDTSQTSMPFYDRGVNMLNVAVSRARESFLLFTDWKRFGLVPATPSHFLRQHIPEENVLFKQDEFDYRQSTLLSQIVNRKDSTMKHFTSEEKTIVQQIIHIHSNEGQVNIANEHSKISATLFNSKDS